MVGNSTLPVHLGLLLCEIGHAGGEFFLFWFFLHFFFPQEITCHTIEDQRGADSEGCLKKGFTTMVYSCYFQWCIPLFCSKSQPMEYFQVWEQIETSDMSNITNYCRSTKKLKLWSEWFMKWWSLLGNLSPIIGLRENTSACGRIWAALFCNILKT